MIRTIKDFCSSFAVPLLASRWTCDPETLWLHRQAICRRSGVFWGPITDIPDSHGAEGLLGTRMQWEGREKESPMDVKSTREVSKDEQQISKLKSGRDETMWLHDGDPH